jgi:hypothetical protein
LRPVRCEVVTKPRDVLEHDDGAAVLHAAHLETERGSGPGLDRAGGDLEVVGRG